MPGEEQNILRSELPELDAREVFFVRHAARIRSWAALERDVRARAEELLLGLAEALERFGGVPDLDEPGLTIACNVDQGYPKIKLRRPSWPDAELSVALGWKTGKVSVEGPDVPYVGVLTTGRWREDPSRRTPLIERLASHRSERGASISPWWPTFRRLPIPDRLVHDDRIDLAGYRDHLLAEFRSEWHAVACILDAAVAEDEG